MAEPHPRAGRTRRWRPARALLLAGAIVAIVFSGLFLARRRTPHPSPRPPPRLPRPPRHPAAAVSTAEHAAPASTAARLAPGQRNALVTPAAADGGICNVPGVGDIGGLIGLCKAGSGVVGDAEQHLHPGLAAARARDRRASTR